MEWEYNNNIITECKDGAYGFIYRLHFSNGKMYIGKKDLFSKLTKPNPKQLETAQKYIDDGFVKMGFNKEGKRHYKYQKMIESDWRTYEGSCKETKGLILVRKEILKFCYDSINLTYQEVKFLCEFNCIVDENYLNANILNKFFRGKVR